MAESEPITSPDQRKPINRKLGRIGAILTALVLLSLMFNNNEVSGTAKIWLIGIAAGLVAIVIGDEILRRNGLRS